MDIVKGHSARGYWTYKKTRLEFYLFIPYGSVLYSEWIFLQFKK